MGKNTRKLTLSALFSALGVVTLYVASVWPTGQIGLTAVASLFVAAAVIESGIVSGISVFAVTSLIAFLIVPNRVPPILYVLFLGFYPILKSLLEKRGHIILQTIGKLVVFNASFAVAWFLLREILFDSEIFDFDAVFLFIGGSVVFLLFDYGFTKLIWFYINRISKRIGSKNYD